MSKSWEGGSTRRWRTLRTAILVRDGNRCRLKIAGVCVGTSSPMHVHHLDGKARGDDPTRLIAACAPCNLHEGEPTSVNEVDPPCVPITRWST
jgi:5-methylcytosine-specific restriction endonuclease McrA